MNALAVRSTITSTIDTVTSLRGREFGAYLAETQYELTRMVRNPGIAIPVLLLPCALYALFALLIAGDAINKDPNLGVFLFAAFSIMSVTMPAMFGIGVSLALERDMGLLRLKRAQPAPPAAWVVAKIVAGLVLAVLAYAPILALALASGKLALAPGQVFALSLALMVGTIPFTAMGLMIGALCSGSAAPGFANLIYLPGCYLSGMFFPLPKSMYWQAPIWPQFHVEQFAMHMAGVGKMQFEPLGMALASMLGYTVLFAGVTIWRLARKG
ncbi:MAG TPA: ABC transporter permease [Steroidobacteraceae bacterium]|jgi:ABC-2 type transport system permease protein|nr:ABC transporter permease [Steroidobacteraceae bacterium]